MSTDMKVFENFNLGQALVKSLEQAVEFEQGDKTSARVIVREIPIPDYAAQDIVRVRDRYKLSQRGLALALNVSPRTVEAWEAGKNKPAGSSLKLLYLIETDNDILKKLVSIHN
jgi:putative transcriptional regulator